MNYLGLIQKWIKEGEGPQLDFKKTIKSSAKIAKTIVAYANSRGGKIVVGITDEGRIKGVKPEQEKFTLDKAASEHCVPSIPVQYEEMSLNGLIILVAHVRESRQKPHWATDDVGNKELYVRMGDETLVASPFVEGVLRSGDLNNLQRTAQLIDLKKKLTAHLTEVNKVSIKDYMEWRNSSERSAKRLLVDLVLEGTLSLEESANEPHFYLRN